MLSGDPGTLLDPSSEAADGIEWHEEHVVIGVSSGKQDGTPAAIPVLFDENETGRAVL